MVMVALSITRARGGLGCTPKQLMEWSDPVLRSSEAPEPSSDLSEDSAGSLSWGAAYAAVRRVQDGRIADRPAGPGTAKDALGLRRQAAEAERPADRTAEDAAGEFGNSRELRGSTGQHDARPRIWPCK